MTITCDGACNLEPVFGQAPIPHKPVKKTFQGPLMFLYKWNHITQTFFWQGITCMELLFHLFLHLYSAYLCWYASFNHQVWKLNVREGEQCRIVLSVCTVSMSRITWKFMTGLICFERSIGKSLPLKKGGENQIIA